MTHQTKNLPFNRGFWLLDDVEGLARAVKIDLDSEYVVNAPRSYPCLAFVYSDNGSPTVAVLGLKITPDLRRLIELNNGAVAWEFREQAKKYVESHSPSIVPYDDIMEKVGESLNLMTTPTVVTFTDKGKREAIEKYTTLAARVDLEIKCPNYCTLVASHDKKQGTQSNDE